MVGVASSNLVAPTNFGRKIKHLAETLGAFFLFVREKYGNLKWNPHGIQVNSAV
jgi:hypothetical protein